MVSGHYGTCSPESKAHSSWWTHPPAGALERNVYSLYGAVLDQGLHHDGSLRVRPDLSCPNLPPRLPLVLREMARRVQLPLRLAWALSVHKAQVRESIGETRRVLPFIGIMDEIWIHFFYPKEESFFFLASLFVYRASSLRAARPPPSSPPNPLLPTFPMRALVMDAGGAKYNFFFFRICIKQ